MKEYSLAIGIAKIRELRQNKGGIISHVASKKWENFYKKESRHIRFFDTVFYEEIKCEIVDIKKVYLLQEPTIVMKVTVT